MISMLKMGGRTTLNHRIKAMQHHTQPTKHHNPNTNLKPINTKKTLHLIN